MPTEYGDINQRTAAYAAVEMLEHARPIIVLADYGQSKPLPKNKADNVKFRRPIPFTVSTTQLTEGVTPTSHKMLYEDVPAPLGQYGDVCEITDKVADLSEDPVLKDASGLSGEQAAETIEMITWGVLKGGTNLIYSTGTARSAVRDPITLSLQRRATRFIKAQRGKKITSRMNSSVNYGTEAVDAAYLAFGHTDLESDVRDMTGFVPVEKYGSMKPLPYEVGKVEDVRYILTPLLERYEGAAGIATGFTGTTASDTTTTMTNDATKVYVYPVVIIAKESYGVIPLRGEGAIKPMVLNPGTPSKSDPMGQRGFVSWKCWFAAVILNQAWAIRLEVGTTNLADVA